MPALLLLACSREGGGRNVVEFHHLFSSSIELLRWDRWCVIVGLFVCVCVFSVYVCLFCVYLLLFF